MKPKPNQDVANPNAVSPKFSGALPVSTLVARTEAQRKLFRFIEEDRAAVEAVLKQDPFPDNHKP